MGKLFTAKQDKVFSTWVNKKPRLTLLSGGKRAGKTYLLIIMFLINLEKLKETEGRIAICGGSLSTIRRNIISELEKITGLTIKLGVSNEFTLFGQTIYCIGIGDTGAMKIVRGFTAKLILINEVSEMSDDVVKELQDRCSAKGGKVLMDTNPTNKYTYIYTDIISKGNEIFDEDGNMTQLVEHFTMLDNTTLTREYVNSQLIRYPKGTTDYKRHILGLYADAEGLVYPMFTEEEYVIKEMPRGVGVVKYICGQDFGYGDKHAGSLIVYAKLTDGRLVVVDGEIKENMDIEYWANLLVEYNSKYFIARTYSDNARPDLIHEMQIRTNMEVRPATKGPGSVALGIDFVKDLLTDKKLLFLKGGCPKELYVEFSAYSWNKKSDKPIGEYDNGLDGMRYGIYEEYKQIEKPETMYSDYTGPRMMGLQRR